MKSGIDKIAEDDCIFKECVKIRDSRCSIKGRHLFTTCVICMSVRPTNLLQTYGFRWNFLNQVLH